MRRAVVVFNPISGRGRSARIGESVAASLGQAGIRATARPTRGPGDASLLAKEAALEGADIVVAVGGDGTVNEVAAGLLAAGDVAATLAIVPTGTANLVARELGIPLDADRAALAIPHLSPRPLDVGEVNGRAFLACVGVGFDAHVVRRMAEARDGPIRFATYLKPIVAAAASYRFAPLSVTGGDGERAEGVLALVFNARPYAAFFTPVPDARSDDGFLDALVLRRAGKLDVPRWIWKARRGTLHEDESATVLRSTRFRIESDQPLPYQIDGDVGEHTPVDILVRPGAIRVLRPDEGAPPPGTDS